MYNISHELPLKDQEKNLSYTERLRTGTDVPTGLATRIYRKLQRLWPKDPSRSNTARKKWAAVVELFHHAQDPTTYPLSTHLPQLLTAGLIPKERKEDEPFITMHERAVILAAVTVDTKTGELRLVNPLPAPSGK
jgi:hypothetical protein